MATRTNPVREPRTHAERRNEAEKLLLQAAVRIVAERGLERFTLTDVGEAAGYSRGLPAHYFGSKDGLIGAVAAHIMGRLEITREHAERHPPGLERLLGTISFYFDNALRDPMYIRVLFVLLGEAVTNPVLRAPFASFNAKAAKFIDSSIRAGIANGDIHHAVSSKTQSALILSGMRDVVAMWLVDPDKIDLKALHKEFVASLKRNLAP